MKTLLITFLFLCSFWAAGAQESSRVIPPEQVIEPYQVEVTFAKTVHILFPAAVKYVDLGSTDLVAGKAAKRISASSPRTEYFTPSTPFMPMYRGAFPFRWKTGCIKTPMVISHPRRRMSGFRNSAMKTRLP